jgi:HEAT repeat protein
MTPRQSVEKECRERGRSVVVAGCVDLLAGKDVDPSLVYALGGPPARWAVSGGEGGPDYWLRVWAARGLLWAWDDSAGPALEQALSDPAWRVREMAAKVAGRHRHGDLLQPLERLRDDPHQRVRAAAERAVSRIVTGSA